MSILSAGYQEPAPLGDVTGLLEAYETLREMGFGTEEAGDIAMGAMSILSFEGNF